MWWSQLLPLTLIVNVLTCNQGQKKLVCYYGSWAIYRPGGGYFPIAKIDPSLCTHLIYAFAGIYDNGTVKILDQSNDSGGFNKFNDLKRQNLNLKTLIAIGGWNEGSVKYSAMVSDVTTRRIFIDSAIDLMKKYRFDGIDIDWEYPCQRGGSFSDKENFSNLIKELRNVLGSSSLLSIAVGATGAMIQMSYDVPSLSANVDFINVMTYDLHGSWDQRTGANSPLYSSVPDPLVISSCISNWISNGASRSKLLVGIPLYARTFTLKSVDENYVGAPTIAPGNPGPYTGESGFMGYNEIVLQTDGWTKVWDDVQKVPYMYKGDQWMSYEDESSVNAKIAFIKNQTLGGAMVWSIETDIQTVMNTNQPLIPIMKKGLE